MNSNARLVTAPEIFVVARSAVTTFGMHAALASTDLEWAGTSTKVTDPASRLVEFSGRLCYLSFGEGRQSARSSREYVSNLLKQGHGSVLDHPSWTLAVAGVSRSLSHELVRHHVGTGVSQLSQRFVDDPRFLRFVIPPALRGYDEKDTPYALFRSRMEQAVNDYLFYKDSFAKRLAAQHPFWNKHRIKKATAEAARSILPNATETRLSWTLNARAARNFLAKRGGEAVEVEMRLFAVEVANILMRESPDLFQDVTISNSTEDGEAYVRLKYGLL